MNIGWQRIFLLIILFGAAFLALVSFWLSSYGSFIGFSTSRTFVFIMFNSVTSFVLVNTVGQSAEGHHETFPFGDVDYEAAEENSTEMIDSPSCSSDSDDEDFDYYNSDGYEDDDDRDSNDGISWDRDSNDGFGWDSDDDHLESKIEEFIAKVIKGWKEELLADNLDSKKVD